MKPIPADPDSAIHALSLAEQSHNYQAIATILNSLDALVYVSDMQTYDLIYMNDYGAAQWGLGAGRKCYQVLQAGQNLPCQFCTNPKLVNAAGQPTGVLVWEFQNTVNGRWYQCRDQAIRWIDDRLVRIEIATDITERKQMEQELANAKALAERQANTDELTQLNNRWAFFNQSRQVFHQVHRAGQMLSIIMFDIDHFKRVNDDWSHAAGDAVLVDLSALAQSLVRGSDVLARVGGEEFAIVLPDTNIAQAKQLAERMRAGFEQHKIAVEGGEISCTASFGIACADLSTLKEGFDTQVMLEALLHKADKAMMQAKVTGRNKVCVDGEG